jgi:wyosine [tRNA(Phe)-imidazoG37] synthetase (radical SAM superfamily)
LQWNLRLQLPTAEEVRRGLIDYADRFGVDDVDAITLAGNGKPTLSNYLDEIADTVTRKSAIAIGHRRGR